MPRGNGLYRVVPLVALLSSLALSSCRVFDYEQREPWRAEAEEKCLAEKLVQPTAYIEPESSIDGPGTCGMVHPFKVSAMDNGQVELTPKATLACPAISEVNRWVEESVQRSAMIWFGEPVVEIHQISAYSCRGMNGQPGAHISEHAFGNALDVAAFKLQSGHKIVVRTAWKGGSYEERGFLRDVAMDACQNFATVLAPGSNVYHYDHIHLDLSRRASGNTYCKPQVARLAPQGQALARARSFDQQRFAASRAPAPRASQVAMQPAQETYRQPRQQPYAVSRASEPQQRYDDLPLGERPPEYEPRRQSSQPYPQPAGAQPMDLHQQQNPTYVAAPPMQAAPSYAPNHAPAYAPEPQYRAPDPYRPLPPRNVGAKLKQNDEILTGSLGKKAHEKTPGRKTAHGEKPVTQARKTAARPAPKPAQQGAPMAGTDLFSPVPMAKQSAKPGSQAVGEAALKALRAN